MSRTALATLGWLVAGLAFLPAAHACSLIAIDPKDKVKSADVAIYGAVTSVRMLDAAPAPDAVVPAGRRFEAKIRVSRVFKGSTGRVIRIRGNTDEAACGIGVLRVRQRVGLVLDRPSRPYRVGLGSRIALRDLMRATNGRWRAPR